jgi:small subunit ribosomal protein S8e
MVQYHQTTKKKSRGSGGKTRASRDKRLAHYGGFFAHVRLAKEGEKATLKEFRVRGGGHKVASERASFVNLATPEGVKKAKIITVVESSADRHFARENILVKGSIVETELGKARVTSRPGQHGVVNAVLIKK